MTLLSCLSWSRCPMRRPSNVLKQSRAQLQSVHKACQTCHLVSNEEEKAEHEVCSPSVWGADKLRSLVLATCSILRRVVLHAT
eukprot:5086849-Amphidinium_carterae.2